MNYDNILDFSLLIIFISIILCLIIATIIIFGELISRGINKEVYEDCCLKMGGEYKPLYSKCNFREGNKIDSYYVKLNNTGGCELIR